MNDKPKKKKSPFDERPIVQAVGARKIRKSVWKAALERHNGNITHASEEFDFSKQRGFALNRQHGLVEYARTLRIENGQPATGRPRT